MFKLLLLNFNLFCEELYKEILIKVCFKPLIDQRFITNSINRINLTHF